MMTMKTLRKRRTNATEKTVGRREDELPWEVPLSFDPTFLPTALYKTTSKYFPSTNIQNALEPYYSYTVNKNSSILQSYNESANMESGPGGYISAPATPPNLHCLSQSKEASNSCPTIPASDEASFIGKHELSALNTISAGGKLLAPIGVFWDIENCSVPKGRSALVAVQRIRERFFNDHLEAEFVCVCDIRKESANVIQELNDAQVSVVHVAGNSKNAADDKLRQAMRRFADISCSNPINSSWPHPATVVLISGDINFATDLSDLRYRKRLYIILLHNVQTPDALLLCAHEKYVFHSVLSDLPFRPGYRDYTESNNSIPLKGGLHSVDLLVTELPQSNNFKVQNFVRNRLRKLSENCGGKVLSIRGQWALIRFPNHEAGLRASKRMNGEDVLGNKIRVLCSPHKEYSTSDFNSGGNYQENSGEHFKMHLNKSSQGVFNSTSWKPTWKRASDSFRASASRYHHSTETNRYNNIQSTTAASNSSTPNETSRDGSPSLMKTHSAHPLSVNSSQLNNSSQYQPSSQVNVSALNTTVGSPLFAFHQNLYPNAEAGMNTLRQECQTSQQHLSVDVLGAGSPRLYSTLATSDGSAPVPVQPLSNNNQHNLNMQLDLNKLSPTTGNGAVLPQSQSLYASTLASSGVDSHTNGTISAANGSTSNYSKFRNSDGDTFDLNVTNVDSSIGDWKTIRTALHHAFMEHVGVRGIWVYTASDGSASAIVRLNSKDDAHYAVAQLHRRKIGNKRIFISFDQGSAVDHETLKKEVASLLKDVPNHTLPLFKFREMFEKRYKRSVSSSDLYRMKDVVQISETSNTAGASTSSSGRNISLTSDWQKKDGKGLDLYCKIHPKLGGKSEKLRMGWAEKEAEVLLPNVIIEHKILGARIHSLLQSHDGSFPLISFLDCYEFEFGELERATEGRGVPLEHLISCVQGIEIVFGENGMKRVQWHEKKEIEHNAVNPQLATQLTQFGRELIDLLKTFPKCTLPFARLIPSYHAHFGRQCRVADYGHFSLSALLQTLPHIVQIMGAAQNRVLTLSHRAQMKRFATDMLRVLKSQGGLKKQIRMEDFPNAFNSVFPQRQFQPEDYGLCYFSDLVSELIEHSTLVALIKDEDGNNMLAVPKREQTPQEIQRTRVFATEVVELLRHSTRCELEFSKFVPYYHHHFQKQCRVSEYGFSKLAELFDAINDTVVILNPGVNDCVTDDKIIRLTPTEQIKVVGEQICNIIEKRLNNEETTRVEELVDIFLEEHGFLLRPELCGATSMEDLVHDKLEHYVKVDNGEIIPVDRVQIENLSEKAEALLQQAPEYKMKMHEFVTLLSEKCENTDIDAVSIQKDLSHILVVDSTDVDVNLFVGLAPLRIFAYEITELLECHGGVLPLPSLENSYFEKFGRPLRPAQLGYPTVLPMLQAIPDTISIRGKHRTKRVIILNSAKSAFESSLSDESSPSNGTKTPRSGSGDYWKHKGIRPHSSGGSSRYGRYMDWSNSPKRRSAPPPPLFSPLGSPAFVQQGVDGNAFGFDRPTPLSPPVYDIWMQESVAPGSPPMSPPVVWTCHPIFYPSSPPPGGAGNILVTSPYVGPAPWSPPPVNTNCFDRVPAPQTVPMLGNEFLFGQNRLTATFEGLKVDTGNEA